MNVIIKPRTEIDLPSVENSIQMAFSQHDKIVFIFDLTETTVFNFQCLLKILPLLKKFETDIEQKLEKSYIPFEELLEELKINYENIEQISYSNQISSNFKKTDTISVFTAKWDESFAAKNLIAKDKDKLERWLKVKLDLDTLVVRSLN